MRCHGGQLKVREILSELGVRPTKRRGQNFLFESSAASKIVAFARLSKDNSVLEVGPGLGALTEHILSITEKYLFVEVEEKFSEYLIKTFDSLGEHNSYCGSILEASAKDLAERLGVEKFRFVSNAPYSISTDILLWVINNRNSIKDASLLLQKQFAERIAASPGTKEYGSLTVLANAFAECSLGAVFPGSIFHPSADVESRLLKLTFLEKPRVLIPNQAFFEKVVRAAFSHRRKTLLNSINSSPLPLSKEEVAEHLLNCNISSSRRAETLELEEFAALTRSIYQASIV